MMHRLAAVGPRAARWQKRASSTLPAAASSSRQLWVDSTRKAAVPFLLSVGGNSKNINSRWVSSKKVVKPGPPAFEYTPLFQSEGGGDDTVYRKIMDASAVESVEMGGETFLRVPPEVLRTLSKTAFSDVAHLLRPAHLRQLRRILDDDEASENDKFVAMELLKNANIASARILPGCQDTGTAIVMGKKGHRVLTDGTDDAHLSGGAYDAYTQLNLRYSQVAPLDMFTEKNTGHNLPAQIDLYSTGKGAQYDFLFIAKGGGSANKTFLYQQTKALLNTGSLESFLEEKIKTIGTSACPPYHLAIVIGGLSAELTLKTVKLASTNCSADRQVKAKITADGVFLEQLEENVAQYLPEPTDEHLTNHVVEIDLNAVSMKGLRDQLSNYPIRTRLSLTGTIVVARDIAHAKMLDRLEAGGDLPQYAKDHIIYYAGPAKTPDGYASGSFGPTTAGRMDAYVDKFMAAGGSFITLAKGNRSKQVTRACAKYGGFYLGSIGGPAAILAKNCITNVEVLDNEEDGMEAVWKIDVVNFPAFIVVDDKGEDFFKEWLG
eukprot:scaffold9208_cov57-Attheya_sp.AAC.1